MSLPQECNLIADIPWYLRIEMTNRFASDWIQIAEALGFEPSRFTCCTPAPGTDPNLSFSWMLMKRLVETLQPVWQLRRALARLRLERHIPDELFPLFRAPTNLAACASDHTGIVTVVTRQTVHRYQGCDVAALSPKIQLPRVADILKADRVRLSSLVMSFLCELLAVCGELFPAHPLSVLDLLKELAIYHRSDFVTLAEIFLEHVNDMTIERLAVCIQRVQSQSHLVPEICDNTEEVLRLLGYFPHSDRFPFEIERDIVANLRPHVREQLMHISCPIIPDLADECGIVEQIQKRARSTMVFVDHPSRATVFVFDLIAPMRVQALCLYLVSMGIRTRKISKTAREVLHILGRDSFGGWLDAHYDERPEPYSLTASLSTSAAASITPEANRPAAAEKASESAPPNSLCSICIDAPQELAVVPCGHLCMCIACSKDVTACPICRVEIQSTLRIFSA